MIPGKVGYVVGGSLLLVVGGTLISRMEQSPQPLTAAPNMAAPAAVQSVAAVDQEAVNIAVYASPT